MTIDRITGSAKVTGRAEVMDAADPGGLGGTCGGSPTGFAAAHAVLDVIEDEGLCDRANQLGARLKQRLAGMRDTMPEIADIRGPGFMNAVEFNLPDGSAPHPDFANTVRTKALDRGLILSTCGTYDNVIRLLALVTIPNDGFDEALDILEASIADARLAMAASKATEAAFTGTVAAPARMDIIGLIVLLRHCRGCGLCVDEHARPGRSCRQGHDDLPRRRNLPQVLADTTTRPTL